MLSVDTLFMIHGLTMFTAYLILLPLGIYVGRYCRGSMRSSWLTWHRILMYLTMGLALAGGSLAFYLCSGSHLKSPHQILGVTLAVLILIQAIGGQVLFYYRQSARRAPSFFAPVHRWHGICLGLLGLVNVGLGINAYKGYRSGGFAAYAIYVCALVIVFVVSEIKYRK